MNAGFRDNFAADPPLSSRPAAEELLRSRAQAYAVRGQSNDQDESLTGEPILLCRLHDERYAIDLALLSAVQAASGLTPLPCTPSYVSGVLNVRGTVVTVLDLAQCLGLGQTAPDEGQSVVLTDCGGGGGQGAVGLLVHEVLGTQRLASDRLAPPLSGDPAIRGLAEGGIVLLDLPRLLGDGRFEVYEEV